MENKISFINTLTVMFVIIQFIISTGYSYGLIKGEINLIMFPLTWYWALYGVFIHVFSLSKINRILALILICEFIYFRNEIADSGPNLSLYVFCIYAFYGGLQSIGLWLETKTNF